MPLCSHCGQDTPALVGHCTTCGKPIEGGARPDIATDVATPPPHTVQTTRLPGSDATQAPPRGVGSDTSDTTGLPPGASRHPKRGIGGPLVPGQNFGTRYRINKVLGMGGMGAVYQAWDKELGVAVALKVIRPDVMDDPWAAQEFERRFKREILLARQVTHPHVVRIHDLGEIDGIKYITMPYLEGEDLASLLRKSHKLDVPAALRIVRQIVSGLQAAHEAGVVHRDLKPANIMVVDNHAIILDFGVARLGSTSAPGTDASLTARVSALQTYEQTRVGAMVGTVKYMAPEQTWGENVDGRADIYAIGLILRDVLLGGRQVPIDTDPLDELRQRMKQAPPSARSIDPQIPEALDRVISRCVQPNPAERYQTTAELAGLKRLRQYFSRSS